MTNVQSKLEPIYVSCKTHLHPWTDSCWNSTAGLMLQASQHSVRIYTAVYLLSLLMRGRIPNQRDIKRTILGIIQSSAFLTTNGFCYVMFACLLRKIFGKFYFFSIAYIPAFMASFVAIFIERPTRRTLLTLYVANVATETLWKMAASRGYIKSVPYGQAIIFGLSSSILLYYYRLGLQGVFKDSLFDICRFVVGRNEEGPPPPIRDAGEIVEEVPENENQADIPNEPMQPQEPRAPERNNYQHISQAVLVYSNLIKKLKTQPRHKSCPHNHSCIYYSLRGGLKLFSVGLGLQVTLKLVLQMRKFVQFRLKFRKTILNFNTLKLGIFLGGFSFLYKSISCALRHVTGEDNPAHAIPAGFIASIAFTQYPDTTVALYVMWKMFQITYNIGIAKGIVPNVPGFKILLYCAATATLFQAALLEPLNLRPSYWKFLQGLSGGRVSAMDRRPLDVWGLGTSKAVEEIMKLTHTPPGRVRFAFS